MQILFDLDGTLTDPFVGITSCIQFAMRSLGHPVPPAAELAWCIGPPLLASIETLLGPESASRAGEALEKYRERFSTVGLFENKVYEGIEAVLIELIGAGHTLRVATSKPRVFARRIIDHFALDGYFATVDGSELDGTRVDKAELIALILEREGLLASDTVMIGDREHDMIGATRNGVSTIGVLWGYGSREELEAAHAGACVAEPGQLPAAVSRCFEVK